MCLLILIGFTVGKYFDEISQDTGKYCFGVVDTLKALEMGAVEILIVWENLEIMRYLLKNHSADGTLLCLYALCDWAMPLDNPYGSSCSLFVCLMS